MRAKKVVLELVIIKIILVVVAIFFLGSCNTAKWCSTHCSKIIKDSIIVIKKDSIVPRDSVVLIPRDSFEIHFKDSVPCKDFKVTEIDKRGNKATVEVKDGHLTVDGECAEVKIKLQWFEHHYQEIKEHWHSEYSPPVVIKKKWLSFWQSWVCIGIGVFVLTIFIFKKLRLKIGLGLIPPYISINRVAPK